MALNVFFFSWKKSYIYVLVLGLLLIPYSVSDSQRLAQTMSTSKHMPASMDIRDWTFYLYIFQLHESYKLTIIFFIIREIEKQ